MTDAQAGGRGGGGRSGEGSAEPHGAISRREMIQTTAAALATPLLPLRDLAAGAAGASGRFLTPAEFALLDELTELIIPGDDHSPGARAAGVVRFIDDRLAESLEPNWQALWRSGLGAVDGLSRALNGKAFLQATPDQRVAVLSRMAAAESVPQTPPEQFFKELKRWTVHGYYTSKVGIHVDQEYKGNVYQRGEFAGFDAT